LSALWLTKAAADLIQDPLRKAVKLQWWAACVELLDDAVQWEWLDQWDYVVYHAAEAGQSQVVQQLLEKWACHQPQEGPWAEDTHDLDRDDIVFLDRRYSE
jgi:hypothetical protein